MKAFQVNTLRTRLVLGSGALIGGIVAIAALALLSLRALRQAVTEETTVLSQVAQLSTGILAAAFDEVRAAELYLSEPGQQARVQFQQSADETYEFEER